MADLKKFDEDGEMVETSLEEQEEALAALKSAFNGTKELVFAPGAIEDLKRMGVTEDEMRAIIAKDLGIVN